MTQRSQDPYAFDGAELEDVAVFPLPRAVLFPGTRMPLHIFEPRYREMMADCVAAGRSLMAIAQLTGDWKRDYHGRPPIRPVAGVGRIEHLRENGDGTYDFQLFGLTRVRLRELPMEDRPYRRARAEPLVERLPKTGVVRRELTSLYSLAVQVSLLVQQREPRFALLASPDDPAGRLVDRIADQFIGDPEVRQDLLEMLDVERRRGEVAARLSHLQLALLASDGGDDDDDRTLH